MAWRVSSGSQVLRDGHQAFGDFANVLVAAGAKDVIELLDKLVMETANDPTVSTLATKLQSLLKVARLNLNADMFTCLRECIEALLGKIMQHEEKLKQQEEKLKQQEEKLKQQGTIIAELQAQLQQVHQLLSSSDKERRKILLSQLPCTVDKLLSEYILGPMKGFMTIGDFEDLHNNGMLKPDQDEKWLKFCSFAEKHGFRVKEVIVATRPLRRLRSEPAHGWFRPAHSTVEEHASVSAVQLRVWAAEFEILEGLVDKLIAFLELFSEQGQPLVCPSSISRTIETSL